jgi:type 1 glutamine amidotransferase
MKARLTLTTIALSIGLSLFASADHHEKWVTYEGKDGPGKGKHIVLISGDEEYRTEESMPMLGKILSQRHGFTCTVLFALDADGIIDPNQSAGIVGLENLEKADLMIIGTRFRRPDDEGMEHIDEYLKAGKPVIGLRTATHAFNGLKGKFAKYNNGYGGDDWKGGFGREILGEKWVNHHGHHGRQATGGVLADGAKEHPVMRGVDVGKIFGPSDVYGINLPLPGDSKPLVLGAVLENMEFGSKPIEGKKNDPMMPVCWVKSYEYGGKKGRVFNTTMGASQDFVKAGLRRIVVNACYWCLEMDVPKKAKVGFVGKYEPSPFGFKNKDGYWKGIGKRPSDHKL